MHIGQVKSSVKRGQFTHMGTNLITKTDVKLRRYGEAHDDQMSISAEKSPY